MRYMRGFYSEFSLNPYPILADFAAFFENQARQGPLTLSMLLHIFFLTTEKV